MRLIVLGSGGAFSAYGANASYCLDGRLLVDCGSPLHQLLPRVGVDVHAPDVLLITHFHFDHVGQVPLLLGARALLTTPARPLTLAGPPGTREYLLRLLRTGYGGHLLEVIQRHLEIREAVLQDGSDLVIEGYRVRARSVVHSTGPSLAYAVTGPDGATVGFSGDSTDCAGLDATMEWCDLMVVECSDWTRPVLSHLWAGEVRSLMERHPEVQVLITHLAEPGSLPGALVAHDRLALDVTSGGTPLPAPPQALLR